MVVRGAYGSRPRSSTRRLSVSIKMHDLGSGSEAPRLDVRPGAGTGLLADDPPRLADGTLGGGLVDDEQALLHALPPLTLRLLVIHARPPVSGGSSAPRWRAHREVERPARMAKRKRKPEWRQGRPPGRPEGTRGAEQSEHRSALNASGGRSYLGGAGERSRRSGALH